VVVVVVTLYIYIKTILFEKRLAPSFHNGNGRLVDEVMDLIGDHRLDTSGPRAYNLGGRQVCSYCGEPAYTKCMVCPEKPALHFFPTKGPNKGKRCYLDYHNDCCFELVRRDFQVLLGKRRSGWSPPSDKQKKVNAKHIENLVANESKATNLRIECNRPLKYIVSVYIFNRYQFLWYYC
jgi:hypothetical protein